MGVIYIYTTPSYVDQRWKIHDSQMLDVVAVPNHHFVRADGAAPLSVMHVFNVSRSPYDTVVFKMQSNGGDIIV